MKYFSHKHKLHFLVVIVQITFRVRASLFHFTPFDVELNVLVFQVPYVLTELGSVPVPFVSK